MNKFFSKKQNIINIAIFLIAIFFIADRVLKYLAINSWESKNILGEILKFNFTANKYIAFSLPLSGLILNLFIFFILFLILIYLAFLFYKKRHYEFLGFLAIFCGALSNLIDRLKHSFVVDYLDLYYFTVFNLADVLIFFGSLFLLSFYFKKEAGEK
ncbi:MAG: signal peptidase II [Patescibacteria group bacterium]|nr:signal peptidase II [Patescibacteria group bacterium]